MSPSPIVTGSISSSTWRDARVAEVEGDLEVEAEAAQHRQRHRELHAVPTRTPIA